jgi:hypothetical protein
MSSEHPASRTRTGHGSMEPQRDLAKNIRWAGGHGADRTDFQVRPSAVADGAIGSAGTDLDVHPTVTVPRWTIMQHGRRTHGGGRRPSWFKGTTALRRLPHVLEPCREAVIEDVAAVVDERGSRR